MTIQQTPSNAKIAQFNPLHYFNLFIDMMRNLPVEERKHIVTEIPNPLDIAETAFVAISEYHMKIAKYGSEWSMEVKINSENLIKPLFYPIAFCFAGRAIGDFICQDLFGNLMRTTAFIAFQFFHVIPYALGAAAISGTLYLYQTAPVTLLTTISGNLLALQVYYIFRLVKEIEVTNQILDQRLDEISRRFDVLLLCKNTAYSTWDLTKRVIKTAAWFWPAGQNSKQVTVGQ